MIKRSIKLLSCAILSASLLTSCYVYTDVVGDGAQGNKEVTQWNHYVIFGLAPVDVSDSQEMANGATNYEVTTKQSFINGLIAGLTFGIYTPTVTTVKY